jgi:hypothetical protein
MTEEEERRAAEALKVLAANDCRFCGQSLVEDEHGQFLCPTTRLCETCGDLLDHSSEEALDCSCGRGRCPYCWAPTFPVGLAEDCEHLLCITGDYDDERWVWKVDDIEGRLLTRHWDEAELQQALGLALSLFELIRDSTEPDEVPTSEEGDSESVVIWLPYLISDFNHYIIDSLTVPVESTASRSWHPGAWDGRAHFTIAPAQAAAEVAALLARLNEGITELRRLAGSEEVTDGATTKGAEA